MMPQDMPLGGGTRASSPAPPGFDWGHHPPRARDGRVGYDGREAQAHLVEQQEASAGGPFRCRAQQGPGEYQHLLLAARQQRCPHVHSLLQFGERLQRLGVPLHRSSHSEVLPHHEISKDRSPLLDMANSQPGPLGAGQSGHLLAVEADLPGPRRDQSRNSVQERGLACAIGAKQDGQLPGPDGQVHGAQDVSGAAADRQAPDVKQPRRHEITALSRPSASGGPANGVSAPVPR